MTGLTIYKQLTYIETFDGDLIPLAEDYKNVVAEYNSPAKAMDLGGEIIAKTAIKRIFTKEVNEIDNLVLQIADKHIRARVQAKLDERKKQWLRINTAILDNIIAWIKRDL